MNVALFTLTRDRLDYTKHCFEKLYEYAGRNFDHYVLDQGSTDGSEQWLVDAPYPLRLVLYGENIGIANGLNYLYDRSQAVARYDVIIHFDNDCELTQPDTIRDLASLVVEGQALLSPRILGLNNPPQPIRKLRIGDDVILDMPQIGGICLGVPGWVFEEFRYPDNLPKWGMDDATICKWWREQGGTCGYVERLEAWHYRTTQGQHEDHGWYFERRVKEGGPA